MDLYTKRLVREFEKKHLLYEEFCFSINKLLRNLLDEKKYKYQIYYRVKSASRLKEKISRKKKTGKTYRSLADIEDLAGIRIIFYLERFLEMMI